MKIRLAQINPTVGDIQKNCTLIKSIIADSKGSDIVVFPELSLTGYPPQDLLLDSSFLDMVDDAINNIVDLVSNEVVIVGVPRRYNGSLYNSAVVLQNGKILGYRDKTLIPSYDVFDEARYFASASDIAPIDITVDDKKINLGVQICEDLWDDNYSQKVSNTLIDKGADMIVNISASPFREGVLDKRLNLCADKSTHLKYYFIYCNLVGAQDELVYDGRSFIIDSNGEIKKLAKIFEEDIVDFDSEIEDSMKIDYPNISSNEKIYRALCLGVKDYFKKTGFKKAVIGLSGGIDSALTAAIAADSLGNENVIGVSMPSKFSSEHSKSDARELAEKLGIQFEMISIHKSYNQIMESMEVFFNGTSPGLAEENLQARIRGNILMSISNKTGALLLNTGNKTELALGYCTMYGDMCGALGVISDLNKKQVYSLSKWVNNHYEGNIIPESIISKKPSAELRENQYDPFDYDLVSPMVDLVINDLADQKQLLEMGYDIDLVNEILELIHRSEHKRRQSPPGIKVSNKAFGFGRRYPIVNQFKGN